MKLRPKRPPQRRPAADRPCLRQRPSPQPRQLHCRQLQPSLRRCVIAASRSSGPETHETCRADGGSATCGSNDFSCHTRSYAACRKTARTARGTPGVPLRAVPPTAQTGAQAATRPAAPSPSGLRPQPPAVRPAAASPATPTRAGAPPARPAGPPRPPLPTGNRGPLPSTTHGASRPLGQGAQRPAGGPRPGQPMRPQQPTRDRTFPPRPAGPGGAPKPTL